MWAMGPVEAPLTDQGQIVVNWLGGRFWQGLFAIGLPPVRKNGGKFIRVPR